MGQIAVPDAGRESALRREVFIVLTGLALVLGGAYFTWFFMFRQNAPDAVVRKFLEADRAGRYTEQQALISKVWEARMIMDVVQAFRRQAGVSPFDNYRILNSSISGQNAQVDVEVTLSAPAGLPWPGAGANQPNVMVVPFHLVLENRSWKIDPSRTMASLTGILFAQGFQQLMPRLQNLIPPNFQPPPGLPTAPPQPPPIRFP